MPVAHVILDADGVVQHGVSDPEALLRRWAGDRAEELGRALWTAERGPLRGEGDFLQVVEAIVPAYTDVPPHEVYAGLWHDVTPSEETVRLVERLRRAGLGVHLGTNQHRQRGERMAVELGYDELFDHSLYSWELGAKKPEPAYFEAALERIGADPSTVLFIDDVDANVEAAREAGMLAERWELGRGHAELEDLLARHGVRVAG